MSQKPKRASCDQLLRNGNMLYFLEMINLEEVKFGCRISNKLLPIPFANLMNSRGGSKTHRYPTRNKIMPNIQKHQSTLFNRSYICKSVWKYNNLPNNLKQKTQKGHSSQTNKNYPEQHNHRLNGTPLN